MQNNPYVGPRPYTRKDRKNFFGRNREARDLLDMMIAERVVLFYAQSGAGKSSLLNAKVIPALEEQDFELLPVVRVGNDLPPGIDPGAVDNVFVFSTLLSLADPDTAAADLTGHTLLSFLRWYWDETEDEFADDETLLPILVWDQFEELFTTHQDRWRDATGFFEQVHEALKAIPELGIVFVMREDYIASIEPYAPLMPRRLRARFRMERLKYKGSLEAAREPAKLAGCPFDEGVAEQLVDNLRRIKTQARHPGTEETRLGLYIEPVQLQVVCHRLWENLPDQEDQRIQWGEIEQFGDVDEALTDFYQINLTRCAQETGVGERDQRRWFAEQLITPMQTRGLVMRGEEETGELPNAAVDVLAEVHLIRSEARAGARWYELCHDRMVDPVLQSNAAWEAARETPLRLAAKQWQKTEESSLLYRDAALKEALAWLEENAGEAEPYEQEFLEASQEAERNRIRRRRIAITGAIVGTLIVIVMTTLAIIATTNARLAFSRQLAAQAMAEIKGNNPDLALLLAIEAVETEDTSQAVSALREVMAAPRLTRLLLAGHENVVGWVNWSEAGDRVLTASDDGTARIWDARTGAELLKFAHDDWVYGAWWSPEEDRILTASKDKTARIWDAQGGAELARLEHGDMVLGGRWSADSRYVLLFGFDGKARVWDVTTGQTSLVFDGHAGQAIQSGEWSPDDARILTVSADKTARIWDAQTGEELVRLDHGDWVNDGKWSADGRYVLTASADQTAQIWDSETGESLVTLEGHEDQVRRAVWNHDESQVLTASDDETARVWDARTGRVLFVLKGHTNWIWSAAWNATEEVILTGSWDGTARVWDAATGDMRLLLAGHTSVVHQAVWDETGQRILTGSGDKTARIWDLALETQARGELPVFLGHTSGCMRAIWNADESRVLTVSDDGTARVWDAQTGVELLVLGGGMGRVLDAAWNRDESQILTAHGNGETHVWDAETGANLLTLVGHEDLVVQASWNTDETLILTASYDGTARLWDAQTGAEVRRFEGQALALLQAVWNAGESRILTCGEDFTARVWDAQTGEELIKLEGHTAGVVRAAWNADQDRIVTASGDGTARVWDAETGEELVSYDHYGSPVNDVVWNAAGDLVLSSGDDNVAVIWDAKTGDEEAVFEDLTLSDPVLSAIWNADEDRVLTVGHDGAARVWDARNGKHLAIFAGHSDTVWEAHWNADESRILTASDDGTARQFYTDLNTLLAAACQQALRNMSLDEWDQMMGDRTYRATCSDLPIEELSMELVEE